MVDDDWLGRWERAYASGDLPWDISRPQPAVRRLAEAGEIEGPALDSGCGSGEHALMLASLGIEAIGVDLSPSAIRQAQAKARARGVSATLIVADVLELGSLGRTFRSVVDCGLFHILDDDERPRYVAALARSVAPDGRVFLLCFSELTAGTEGPRRVTQAEIREAFVDGWTVDRIEPARFEVRAEFMPDSAHAWLATIVRSGEGRRAPRRRGS